MAQKQVSLKRIGVDKTNSRIVVVAAVASFVVMFSIVTSFNLISQLSYQNRVIGAKKTAVKQLQENITNTDKLVASYRGFVTTPQNVIGGDPNGSRSNDGNNAKIVLDALPSKYDFPALATSIEKLTADQGVSLKSITGVDDQVAQTVAPAAGAPKQVEVPFELSFSGGYDQVKQAVGALERSIRPFQVLKTDISGDQAEMTMTMSLKTFYQPERSLNIQTKVMK